jgi:hypothetical protein
VVRQTTSPDHNQWVKFLLEVLVVEDAAWMYRSEVLQVFRSALCSEKEGRGNEGQEQA